MSQAKPDDPKYSESRPKVEVAGIVTGVEPGPSAPPPDLQPFFYGSQGASQVLTIAGEDGLRWVLGFSLERGKPSVNTTPDLRGLLGKRVVLLFRAIRAFGEAPGFVLSGPDGLALAMDLAVYGDPLEPNDVPGLTVQDGPVLATITTSCADEKHTSLIFSGDQPVEVAPGAEAVVAIKGTRYLATNLFSYRASGQLRCTDIAGEARGWAVWRAP